MAKAADAIKDDPSKTVGIRKRWIAEVNARYTELQKRIARLLLAGDTGGIPVPPASKAKKIVGNAGYDYTSDPAAALRFMAWLQLQIDAVIIGNDATAANNWQNRYIDQSYSRGIERTQADLRRAGIDANMLQSVTSAEIVGTASASLGLGQVNGPIHLDAIRSLYVRSYSDLQGVTDEMAKQIRRALVEGVEQGMGIRDITAALNDRVSAIGQTRSQLIARTETVRAYNVSSVAEFKDVAERAGVPVQFEWQTAGDGRVRPDHAARNGKVYDEAEALSMLGDPNCRCALKPYIDPALTKDEAA